ncbi:hypothetical protein B0H12DRAFT_1070307 [Mycena haematopus]|nr:hypothetical protein B0H12DRAFT_1070307 [Mycena haematopus]
MFAPLATVEPLGVCDVCAIGSSICRKVLTARFRGRYRGFAFCAVCGGLRWLDYKDNTLRRPLGLTLGHRPENLRNFSLAEACRAVPSAADGSNSQMETAYERLY